MKYSITLEREQINELYSFLDRVSITGHNERYAMNNLVNALAQAQEVKDDRIEETKE